MTPKYIPSVSQQLSLGARVDQDQGLVDHKVCLLDPIFPKSGFPLGRFSSIKRTGQKEAGTEIPDVCSSQILVLLSCPNQGYFSDFNNPWQGGK
jgi:hypothetical protein